VGTTEHTAHVKGILDKALSRTMQLARE